jgi:hypothetical protein
MLGGGILGSGIRRCASAAAGSRRAANAVAVRKREGRIYELRRD